MGVHLEGGHWAHVARQRKDAHMLLTASAKANQVRKKGQRERNIGQLFIIYVITANYEEWT